MLVGTHADASNWEREVSFTDGLEFAHQHLGDDALFFEVSACDGMAVGDAVNAIVRLCACVCACVCVCVWWMGCGPCLPPGRPR